MKGNYKIVQGVYGDEVYRKKTRKSIKRRTKLKKLPVTKLQRNGMAFLKFFVQECVIVVCKCGAARILV